MNAVRQRSIALLWNGSSGWSDSDQTRLKIQSVLSESGSTVEVRQVARGVNIFEQCKAIVAGGAEVLVAAGGDGTINAAASALVHQSGAQPTALGVIPAGTLNHFARDLHIPLEAAEAVQVVIEGRVVQVDAAAVNGRVFINNSVLGLFPKYRSARKPWERRGFGASRFGRFIATIASLWRVFWRLPHLTITLQVKGRERTLRTPFVLVGNNEHRMEGLAPRESIFDIFSASQLTIHSRQRRIGVGIDGEVVRMRPPLRYESLPGALRVVAPAAYLSNAGAGD